MKHRLIIRPEADADIEEAFNWYQGQYDGLGRDFLGELKRSLDFIDINPVALPIVYRNIRRALINRFPHAFFYILDGQKIVVIACVHHKRDPKVWKTRS